MNKDSPESALEGGFEKESDVHISDLRQEVETATAIADKTKYVERDLLEDLFDDEFVLDNPPESYKRYEAELSVRHLRNVVEVLASGDGYAGVEATDSRVEAAVNSIDVMGTYGDVAEPHLAALSRTDLPEEVYNHAIEVLGELRQEKEEPNTIKEAFIRWLSS